MNTKTSLSIIALFMLSGCQYTAKSGEKNLEELDKAYDVDLSTVEFTVKTERKSSSEVYIRVTPSSPIQNTKAAEKLLYQVWHQIANEDCHAAYTGAPITEVGTVKRGHLDSNVQNLAIKVLIIHAHGTAKCESINPEKNG